MSKQIIVDATGAILGRLASYAAKQSLLGKSVIVVNCDKAEVTGKRKSTINAYMVKRQRGGHSQKGPFFPKHPEQILKRTIRGMLSYKKSRGSDALKRIKCYAEVPKEFKDAPKIKAGKEKRTKSISLTKLSKEI